MKAIQIISLILAVGFTVNISAAPKPPPEPQDVNVVNTPNVTVTNQQTSVTVDNAAGNPVPVTMLNAPSGARTFEFVGFSSGTFNGGQGVITHTTACQQDFPGSRMCTSVEFLNTVNYPSSLPIGARSWIRPVYQPFTSTGTSQNNYSLDASGVGPTQDGLSCVDGVGHGLTVSATGNFTTTACGADLPVACCAPQ